MWINGTYLSNILVRRTEVSFELPQMRSPDQGTVQTLSLESKVQLSMPMLPDTCILTLYYVHAKMGKNLALT